jgi:hypothetical protein
MGAQPCKATGSELGCGGVVKNRHGRGGESRARWLDGGSDEEEARARRW